MRRHCGRFLRHVSTVVSCQRITLMSTLVHKGWFCWACQYDQRHAFLCQRVRRWCFRKSLRNRTLVLEPCLGLLWDRRIPVNRNSVGGIRGHNTCRYGVGHRNLSNCSMALMVAGSLKHTGNMAEISVTLESMAVNVLKHSSGSQYTLDSRTTSAYFEPSLYATVLEALGSTGKHDPYGNAIVNCSQEGDIEFKFDSITNPVPES